jgi:hypothetical protein
VPKVMDEEQKGKSMRAGQITIAHLVNHDFLLSPHKGEISYLLLFMFIIEHMSTAAGQHAHLVLPYIC